MLNPKWAQIVKEINFAFQPIVNIKSGKTYGVEVLLRNFKEAGGFYSIANFFDEAYNDGVLYQVDLSLRLKMLKKYSKIDIENVRLFYNIDYRIMNMPDFTIGNTQEIFEHLKLDKGLIYFEISEKISLKDPNSVRNLANRYKQEGYGIAIDNFASGVSGFQLLYYPNSDFIKLDRLFISDISKDTRKRLFLSSIINMAHIVNIKVIASQVENIEEYYVCKDLGVDFIQGFFIQKPTLDTYEIESSSKSIKELYKNDQRDNSSNIIDKQKITKLKALNINSSMEELFIYFRENPENHFAPIVDNFNNLLGAVYEKDIKNMSYSQFGMSLARNANMELSIKKFSKDVVSAEITWSVDKILDIYNITQLDKSGIFITKNNEYFGFVNLNNLLEFSYYRNIEIARDQNPLTKLPGNSEIENFLAKVFDEKREETYYIVYFDFNDFKPFNDSYGFRQGDRAILIFSSILKKELSKENIFLGHIGGDDFFVGFENTTYDDVYKIISKVQKDFRDEVSSLYSQKDRSNGYLKTKDRFGETRHFKLLAVAAAILEINANVTKQDFDEILHTAKKSSKLASEPLGFSILETKVINGS